MYGCFIFLKQALTNKSFQIHEYFIISNNDSSEVPLK